MTDFYVSQSATNGYAIGADSNNGTSKATPFLTVGKAFSVGLTNDTITINDGVYLPTDGGFGNFYSYSRAGTVKAETYRGAILRGIAGQTRVANFGIPASALLNINNIVFDASTLGAASADCVDTSSQVATWIYSGCDFIGSSASNGGCVKINSGVGRTLVQDCRVRGNVDTWGIHCTTLTTGVVEIENLEVDLPAITASLGGAIYLQASSAGSSARISNVFGTLLVNGTGSVGAITCYNISNLLIDGPCGPGGFNGPGAAEFVVGGNTTGTPAIIKILANATISSYRPVVNGFKGAITTANGYAVLVGSDGSGGASSDGMIIDSVVANCDLRGNPASSIIHGVITGWQTGGIHINNQIHGFYLSSIFKDSVGRGGISIGNECYDGYTGGAAHLYSKGCQMGTMFACNRVYMTSGYMNRAFQAAWNNTSTHTDSGSVFLGNNVYSDTAVSNMANVGGAGDASTTPTFAFNNYKVPAYTGSPWSIGQAGTTYADIAAWSSAVERSARSVDPTTISPAFFRRTYSAMVRPKLANAVPWVPQVFGI